MNESKNFCMLINNHRINLDDYLSKSDLSNIRLLCLRQYKLIHPPGFNEVNGSFFRIKVEDRHTVFLPAHLPRGKYPRLIESMWKVVVANVSPNFNTRIRQQIRSGYLKMYLSFKRDQKYFVRPKENIMKNFDSIKNEEIVDPFIRDFRQSEIYYIWRRFIHANFIRHDYQLMIMFCKEQPLLGIYECLPPYTNNSLLVYSVNDLLNVISAYKNHPKLQNYIKENPDIFKNNPLWSLT